MSVLTQGQRDFYHQEGYLLVSNLIPEAISARAQEVMLQWAERDPHNPNNQSGGQAMQRSEEEIAAVAASYTPEIITAASELVGEDRSIFDTPCHPYPLHSYPTKDEWTLWQGHLDHSIKEHGHKSLPRPFRIATMLYLSDIDLHGGGTVVWPRSHKIMQALAESDPIKYEMMWVLNKHIPADEIGEPLELPAKRGSILFYHPFMVHSGSMNITDRIRLAMNRKW
jgi:ectoine hydroxylase-related dioxygenase (phytanoyl-CoA dioxygenase family)